MSFKSGWWITYWNWPLFYFIFFFTPHNAFDTQLLLSTAHCYALMTRRPFWGRTRVRLDFSCGSVIKNCLLLHEIQKISGSERSPGGGNGNPLQDSCLEGHMDTGAWWATVHGVTKSWTQLSNWADTHTQGFVYLFPNWGTFELFLVYGN